MQVQDRIKGYMLWGIKIRGPIYSKFRSSKAYVTLIDKNAL